MIRTCLAVAAMTAAVALTFGRIGLAVWAGAWLAVLLVMLLWRGLAAGFVWLGSVIGQSRRGES